MEREGRGPDTPMRAVRCCCHPHEASSCLRCFYGCRRARWGLLSTLTHPPPRQLLARQLPSRPPSCLRSCLPPSLWCRSQAMGMLRVSRLSYAFVRAGVAVRDVFRSAHLLVCCFFHLPLSSLSPCLEMLRSQWLGTAEEREVLLSYPGIHRDSLASLQTASWIL